MEADPQAFSTCRRDIFANEVAPRPLLRRAVISELRIKIAEAFVMFGGHHHVSHAGSLGELRPGPRGIWHRFEVGGEFLVLADRNAFVLHHPLVPAERAVESPMNKHSELGFMPPLHAALSILYGRSRRGATVGWLLLAQSKFGMTGGRQRSRGRTHKS